MATSTLALAVPAAMELAVPAVQAAAISAASFSRAAAEAAAASAGLASRIQLERGMGLGAVMQVLWLVNALAEW